MVITARNTGVAITEVWAFSSVYIMIQVTLLTVFQLKDLENQQMMDFCGKDNTLSHPISDLYDSIYD